MLKDNACARWEPIVYATQISLLLPSCFHPCRQVQVTMPLLMLQVPNPQGFGSQPETHFSCAASKVHLEGAPARRRHSTWAVLSLALHWKMKECTMVQNRKKNREKSHLILYSPKSEGVSEVSEQANKWVQRSLQAKQVGPCERTSKWTSEWPSTAVCIPGYSGS